MVRALCLILLLILLQGCGKDISRADLHLLNGYWEIEEVSGPDGSSRTYQLNATIDYMQLNGLKGYRKKLQPRLDGSFMTSDDALSFEILQKGSLFIMVYQNGEVSWEEQLIKLDTLSYSVVNAENITYHYKRYEPLVSKP